MDEPNLTLENANITTVFETEQAIPERDSYTFSKVYADFIEQGGTASTDTLTAQNILATFDEMMSAMDDSSVPMEGRYLFATPATVKLLKEAEGLTRIVHTDTDEGAVKRYIHVLDDVQVVTVPAARLKTAYDFTTGAVPADGAGQINLMLIHPDSVGARMKHEYIRVFTPGSDSRTGDGYI